MDPEAQGALVAAPKAGSGGPAKKYANFVILTESANRHTLLSRSAAFRFPPSR